MSGTEAMRAAVEAQAEAHVRGDAAAFASYMTPQALLQIGGDTLPSHRTRRFRVTAIDGDSASGSAEVRYEGSWSYALRSHWQLVDGLWRATDAELVPDSVRAPWWRRIIGRTDHRAVPAPERRDLE